MDSNLVITQEMSEDALQMFIAIHEAESAKVPEQKASDGDAVVYFIGVKAAALAGDAFVAKYGWHIGMRLFQIAMLAVAEEMLDYKQARRNGPSVFSMKGSRPNRPSH